MNPYRDTACCGMLSLSGPASDACYGISIAMPSSSMWDPNVLGSTPHYAGPNIQVMLCPKRGLVLQSRLRTYLDGPELPLGLVRLFPIESWNGFVIGGE